MAKKFVKHTGIEARAIADLSEIELAKERILKMEENIIQNEQDQITANDDIIEQQEKVKQVKENM